MKKYRVKLLFPLILCLMTFACSSNPGTMQGSFNYGWDTGGYSSLLGKEQFHKIKLEVQDGQLDDATKFYKIFLKYLTLADTIGRIIGQLEVPDYIAIEDGGGWR